MATHVKVGSPRVGVYLRKHAELLQKAKFGHCLLTQLGLELGSCCDTEHAVHSKTGQTDINVVLNDNKLILSPTTVGSSVTLKHPSLCPAWHLKDEERINIPTMIAESGLHVGVACLLITMDNHVLLTRRNASMRTFPGVWVPPGGHVELDETLEEAGLRELKEETGLDVIPTKIQTLALWESVFPPLLQQGNPTRHHLVVYQTVHVDQDWQTLLKCMKLEPSEVDAAVWFSPAMVDLIVHGKRSILPPEIPAVVVQDNKQEVIWFSPEVLVDKAPVENAAGLDRVSWGTQFALSEWLNSYKKTKSVL